MRTAVIAAMSEEVAVFRRRLANAQPMFLPQLDLVAGKFRGNDVWLLVSGVGAKRTAHSVERFLTVFSPEQVIFVGVAGALTSDLHVGDVVRAESVVNAATETRWQDAREAVHEKHASSLTKPAVCVSTAEMALTAAAKSALREKWVHNNQPGTVDLESAAFVDLATKKKLPWRVLRAISDNAHDELPAFFADCVTPDGTIDRRRVVRHAAMRPHYWPELIRLKQRVDYCAIRLADTLTTLL